MWFSDKSGRVDPNFFKILADPLQDTFDLAEIARVKMRDPARLAKVISPKNKRRRGTNHNSAELRTKN